MIEKYKTVSSSDWAKLTAKKSRFFAKIYHAKSQKDVKEMLKKAELAHKNPTHIVYAYRLICDNEIYEYGKDAGEPAKSAGESILKIIKNSELLNVCLIVVRYFGGTKLGIGGLIRAYTASAQKAIEESRIITKVNFSTIQLTAVHNELGSIINKVEKSLGKIEKLEYNDVIKITARVPISELQNFNLKTEKT